MADYLITGGLGFVGTNYAAKLLARGNSVTVFDDCSRPGSSLNRQFLESSFPGSGLQIVSADVCNFEAVKPHVAKAKVVVHLAAQVAVTTSVVDPRRDFEVNAGGTLNVLEAARACKALPLVIFPSTNKVYGGLEDLKIEEKETRYACPQFPNGIPETRPLDFHSPYGCSKGAADQYVHDYSRIYGIPSVVLRLSCIYGPRQFGIGDQGWVGWFIAKAVLGKAVAIFGDGKQVRDLLYVDDLTELFDRIVEKPERAAGKIFNVGGGPSKSLSIWTEFSPMLEALVDRPIEITKHDWRPGDQRYYISDISKVRSVLDWSPQTDVKSGVTRLHDWISSNQQILQHPDLKGAY